jgi:uncharacterized protein YbjT (DUF2867 family)
MSRAIVDALRETSVSHIVLTSAIGADRADAAGPPSGLHELEKRLSTLDDANVLLLRSGPYMDYLLANMSLIRSQRINGSAMNGDVKLPMIATQDVAQEAAERLARRDFVGHQAKTLLGPADVTMREATAMIGRLVGQPDLPYVEFPPEDVKHALVRAGMSEEAAGLLVEMQLAVNEGRPFGTVQRTTEATTPTRLEEFLSMALGGVPAAAEGGLQ